MTPDEFALLLNFARTAFESARAAFESEDDTHALLRDQLRLLTELPFLTDTQREQLWQVANPEFTAADPTEVHTIRGVTFRKYGVGPKATTLHAEYRGHVHFPTRAGRGWSLGPSHFTSLYAIAHYMVTRYGAGPKATPELTEVLTIHDVTFARWEGDSILRAEHKGHVHFPTRTDDGGWTLGPLHFTTLRGVALHLQTRYSNTR